MSAARPFEIGLFTFGEITADPITGRFLGLLHQQRVDDAVEHGRPALAVADVVDARADEGTDEAITSAVDSPRAAR